MKSLVFREWGTSAAFLDLDNDGYLDLHVSNYLNFTSNDERIDTFQANDAAANFLFRNEGEGTFSEVAKSGVAFDPNRRNLSGVGVEAEDSGFRDSEAQGSGN